MLEIFDYPVMLSKEEAENIGKIDLSADEKREFLRDAHRIIYDFLIYPSFNEDIKNRIIVKYREALEKPIKKAVYAQYRYLFSNGGNLGDWNGVLSSGQAVDNKEIQEILTKIIAPEAINILKGSSVDILYSGGGL